MEDGWKQGEAGGKETSQEAAVVIQARNDEGSLPSEQAAGMESERWMWEMLERRSLWMLRVGWQEMGKRQARFRDFESGEVMSETE